VLFARPKSGQKREEERERERGEGQTGDFNIDVRVLGDEQDVLWFQISGERWPSSGEKKEGKQWRDL
jgi:hypothetical protein